MATFSCFLKQAAHVGSLDPDAGDELRQSVCSEQFDFRLPVADHMHMGRFVILGVDDEAVAMGAVNDDREKLQPI